jgi:DNA-binding NtrC family response regulator
LFVPHFEITGAVSEPKIWPFPTADVFVVGRARSCDLSLADSTCRVSNAHAAVVRNREGTTAYFIRDLGSRHSTRVNDEGVYQRVLRDGDIVSIADYRLRFRSQTLGTYSAARFRVVQAKESTPDGYGETLAVLKAPIITCDEASREILEQIAQQESRGTPLQALFTEFMPRLLGYLNADRGCVFRFTNMSPLEFEEVATYNLDDAEQIEITDELFLSHLINGQIVQDTSTVLIPISSTHNVKGFFCIDRTSSDRPYAAEHISVLLRVGAYAGRCTEQPSISQVFPSSDSPHEWPVKLVGGRKVNELQRSLQIAAKSDMCVLLYGENGTGKELFAEAIHEFARGKDNKTLVPRDCSTVPETLIATHLFGHEPQAFTGADKAKEGWFETADGGTLFLDEIQALTPIVQDSLLRVLVDHKVLPVGGLKPKKVDVRVIAAMDQDPSKAVAEGRLRKALADRFGRKILIPPLRDRREDIPLLVFYFLDKYAAQYKSKTRSISHRALELLMQYDWPGNVRELRDCIENAVLHDTEIVLSSDLPPAVLARPDDEPEPPPEGDDLKTLEQIEKEAIKKTLIAEHGTIARAAKRLGVADQGLRGKMKRLGIPIGFGRR